MGQSLKIMWLQKLEKLFLIVEMTHICILTEIRMQEKLILFWNMMACSIPLRLRNQPIRDQNLSKCLNYLINHRQNGQKELSFG